MSETTYPELFLLTATYLNQDWTMDYPDVWAAVDAYRQEKPEGVPALRAEIAAVLTARPDEAAVRQLLLDEIQTGYWAPADGYTFRSWLTELSERLR